MTNHDDTAISTPGLRSSAASACATCALAGALAFAAPAAAQSVTEDGLPVGPWLIAPSFKTEYTIDDNVRRAAETLGADDPTERIASAEFSLDAILPFRNSRLELNYVADLLDYAESDLASDLAQDIGFELELRFGSGDRLVLSDTYSEDFARIETLETVDRGGELTFIGEPFRINRWTATLERAIQRRPGYLVQVRRTDFNYQGESQVDFFDYRGFENAYEYRQPTPGDRWVVAHLATRRYKHFDQRDAVGVPFREERSETMQIGLLGELGRQQPFSVRLGYGRFRYEQRRAGDTEFSGLVGFGSWIVNLGDRTKMTLELIRLPLPSNFETYYVYNSARVELERQIVRSTEGRLQLKVGRNRYGDPVFRGCDGGLRDDLRWDVGGELDWRVHPRFGFRLSANHEQRGSNCDFAEYDTTTVGMAIRTGWF